MNQSTPYRVAVTVLGEERDYEVNATGDADAREKALRLAMSDCFDLTLDIEVILVRRLIDMEIDQALTIAEALGNAMEVAHWRNVAKVSRELTQGTSGGEGTLHLVKSKLHSEVALAYLGHTGNDASHADRGRDQFIEKALEILFRA